MGNGQFLFKCVRDIYELKEDSMCKVLDEENPVDFRRKTHVCGHSKRRRSHLNRNSV